MSGSDYTRASKGAKKKRVSSEVRAQEELGVTYLRVHGWWASDGGWRHRAYDHPWPMGDAKLVTEEAEGGAQGLVYRMLRGEC